MAVSYGTRNVVDVDGVDHKGNGSDRFMQIVCVVKSGSRQMMNSFHHLVTKFGLQSRSVGADDGECAHADDMASEFFHHPTEEFPGEYWVEPSLDEIDRPRRKPSGPTGVLVEKGINRSVKAEFVVWGHPIALWEFAERNCRPGGCLAFWRLHEGQRASGQAAGSADAAATEKARKKLRDYVPDQLERDARAATVAWVATEPRAEAAFGWVREHSPNAEKDARAEVKRLSKIHPNNPASPHYGESDRIARMRASCWVTAALARTDGKPTPADRMPPQPAIDAMIANCARFYRRNGRVPQSWQEFGQFLADSAK